MRKNDTLSPPENILSSFLGNPDIPKLSESDAQVCEGKLTISECFKSLQLFQNNKSPGNDGLTVEFYKAFWQVLGKLMVDSLNYSYDHGELSNSQKEAIITLIEKKDKDKRYLSNWRPISLINVDVKIGSKAIAKRLETVLSGIIHYNQCAYVKDRTIFDAIRTVEDIMEFTERYNINGMMICIDFKKAFDTVSRDFLFKTLHAFGFGYSFIQWIHTFYKNISSCVLNNGFSTAPFAVERGVRQGDPLSAYLFIMVLEILCISIRGSKDIQGINVDTEEIKLELFADDLTGFLRNDHSLKKFMELVETFGECSGLRELDLSPLDFFRLVSVINALPKKWQDSLKRSSHYEKKAFSLQEQIVLSLNGQKTQINKVVSKTIYKEFRNRVITTPSAQKKYVCSFINDTLDWKEIYGLPHRVTSDTKLREFQYKLLNRYLVTNVFLNKIGVLPSPACSFCGKEDESLEHILISCNYAKEFWAEVIKWLCNLKVNINNLNNREILFGMSNCEDEIFINHVLLVAKQYLYSCRCKSTFPLIKVFKARLRKIETLELEVAKSKNKLPNYTAKWGKFLKNIDL